MKLSRLFPYFSQGIVIGLIIGLLIIVGSVLVVKKRPQVELREAAHAPAASAASSGPASYSGAVDTAAPAVVNIHTTKTLTRRDLPLDDPAFRRFYEEFLPGERQQTNLGSGVVVNEHGYVLTNNHVIDGADEILVGLLDGRIARASVVGRDVESDIAVLKVPLDGLPTIVLGDSESLRVGDVVLAIGNPYGVGQTVTQGIVSATGRHQLGISTFENFIQTDAAINPGNSGGALINSGGELVGINTAIFSRTGGSQGIGFAIPTSIAKLVMTQIIEHGEAIRGWLGIEIQSLTPELAESFGVPDTNGLVIAGVLADGPAAHARLQAGDVITHIDGKPVIDARSALNLIAQTVPGTTITLTGLRGGKKIELKATVSKRPQPQAATAAQ